MAQYKSFSPHVTVNGETVLTIVNGMRSYTSKANKILEDCGIREPQPGSWYSQQAWLNAFRMLADQLGSSTLFMIGCAIPENAKFPPSVNSVADALIAIDKAYHMNHRGGEIGNYQVVSSGNSAASMCCENPYPCDFDRGVILGTATKYKPSTSSGVVRVNHDSTKPCRKKGADSCTYQINW